MRTLVALLSLTLALPAAAALKHRYSFATDASDSVGSADGTLVGDALIGSDVLELSGTAGTYLNLPGGLLQGLTATTIETWAYIPLNTGWARLFDFGGTNGTVGRNYLFFTPRSGGGDARLAISDADPGYTHEETVTVTPTLDDGGYKHIAVTMDPVRGWAAIYVDGALVASSSAITIPLSAIEPTYCFIGRALYSGDPAFAGSIDEFRIHDSALSSAAVAASYNSGVDAPSFDGGTLNSLSMTLPSQMRLGGVATPQLRGTYAAVGNIAIAAPEVALSSSNPSVLEVAKGTVRALAAGTATITAELSGRTATATVTVQPVPVVLKNRYSFDEAGGAQTVVDSVAGAHGTVFAAAQGGNTVQFGNGQATFPGGATYLDGAYIDMPSYLFSSRTNLSVEVWTTWNGPASSFWQRIFDFGSGTKSTAHTAGNGTGNFFLSPRGGDSVVRFNAAPDGFAGERALNGTAALPIGQEAHVVCIYAPDNQSSQLWVNGRMVDSDTTPFPLSELDDYNNFIGLANWNDAPLNGSINEFRIYEGALTELDIALRRQAGPNALPADPGLLQSLTLQAPNLLQWNPAPETARLLATFENTADLDISALSSVTFTSGDTNVFTAAPGGLLRPVGPGSADLVCSFQGMSTTSTVQVLAPTALQLVVPTPLLAGGAPSNSVLRADFGPSTNASVAQFTNITYASASPNIATVSATGVVLPLRTGSTLLSAQLGSLSASQTLVVAQAPTHQPAEIIHRYSFSEPPGSTTVSDSVGTAHGELVNASAQADFNGTGRLLLQGGAWDAATQGGYVNLPNGFVSSLTSASIEVWFQWAGPADSSWQRVFDFGRNSAVDGQGNFLEDAFVNPGMSYMFLSPRSGNNTLRFAIKQGTGDELPVLDTTPIAVGQDVHVTVVYDTAAGGVRLYLNGQRIQTGGVTHPLSVVEDRNVYLGRAQWTDPYFAGQFDEFRVYTGALTEDQVAATHAAGPNSLPNLVPAPSLEAELGTQAITLSWPADAGSFELQSSTALGTTASWSKAGDPVPVGNQLQVTLPLTGAGAFFRLIQQQ